MLRMTESVATAQERAMDHEPAAPTRRRNNFIRDCFIAPYEAMPFLNHPTEEILVFATRAKLPAKRRFSRIEDAAPEQNIASTALVPRHDKPRRMPRTLIKSAFDEPFWRFVFKVWFHRTEHAG